MVLIYNIFFSSKNLRVHLSMVLEGIYVLN